MTHAGSGEEVFPAADWPVATCESRKLDSAAVAAAMETLTGICAEQGANTGRMTPRRGTCACRARTA